METIHLNSWSEFEEQLNTLEASRDEILKKSMSSSNYLFRGQGNAEWLLDTTLDRYFDKKICLREYFRFAQVARPQIETFTEARWDIPSMEEYELWLNGKDILSFHDFKAYEYFAYLRHHGFPSPLLDWTRSPYVAAFFAFRHEILGATHVSIYAYQEYPGGGKIRSSDRPNISCLGPYVRAHKRHFLQQSQYTICTEFTNNNHQYSHHEKVFERNEPQQDLMWKFIFPISERINVLARLNKMNINAFSLFGTEDSLMETISTNDILLRQ